MSLIKNPMHPGEVLAELYLEPLGLTAGRLAKALRVPRTRVERIVKGETAVTPATAVRLGRYFRTTPDVWLGMQSAFDLRRLEREAADEIERIEPMPAAAA